MPGAKQCVLRVSSAIVEETSYENRFGRKSLDFDELATKFVMGLGRVSYLGKNRSLLAGKLEAMRRYGEGKTWGGKKIMDMGE